MIIGCLKASNNGQTRWPMILKPSLSPNDLGLAKLNRPGQSLKPGSATTPSSYLSRTLRGNSRPLVVLTPRKGWKRSSLTKRDCSDRSKHAALTPQGPRGYRSPRSGQTPSLRHAAQTRQHRPTVTARYGTHRLDMAR